MVTENEKEIAEMAVTGTYVIAPVLFVLLCVAFFLAELSQRGIL